MASHGIYGAPRVFLDLREGNSWDNAVAESFFSSLKKERMMTVAFVTAYRLATVD